MQVCVSHHALGVSKHSRTLVLQCDSRVFFGVDNNALLDAGAFLDSCAREGRGLGYDVLVSPLEVAWIDGLRVSQSWTINLLPSRRRVSA